MIAGDISRTNASRGVTYRCPDLRRRNFGLAGDFFEIILDIVTERASAGIITVPVWPLSVPLLKEQGGRPVRHPAIRSSRVVRTSIWVPLFLGLIVAGAVIMRCKRRVRLDQTYQCQS